MRKMLLALKPLNEWMMYMRHKAHESDQSTWAQSSPTISTSSYHTKIHSTIQVSVQYKAYLTVYSKNTIYLKSIHGTAHARTHTPRGVKEVKCSWHTDTELESPFLSWGLIWPFFVTNVHWVHIRRASEFCDQRTQELLKNVLNLSAVVYVHESHVCVHAKMVKCHAHKLHITRMQ